VPLGVSYPSEEHRQAAEAIVDFFTTGPDVVADAVLQVGSCARGKASVDSCLDMLVLVRPEVLASERRRLESEWSRFHQGEAIFRQLERVGKYANAEVEFSDGCFIPGSHDYTSGADEFELEVGNYVACAVPLWQGSGYFESLRRHWLPYYDEKLARKRQVMVHGYCLNNLAHIEPYARRGLHFQCFARFYHAFQEFLQALFIARRTYPIAYDKWVREEVEGILGLPELYRQLPPLFEITSFESDEIVDKARRLEALLDEYVPADGRASA